MQNCVNCADSLSNMHYLKPLVSLKPKKDQNTLKHRYIHTQNTHNPTGALQEKKRKRKAMQITQGLNYQTKPVAQERSISIPKTGSHEQGLMK